MINSNRRFDTASGAPVISNTLELTRVYASVRDAPFGLGTKVAFDDGRQFTMCLATANIAAGNPVQRTDVIAPLINADVDAAAAVGTTTLTGTGDFTAYVAGGLEGAIVYIDGAAAGDGAGQTRFIKRVVDANIIEVTEPWTVALTVTADYLVYRLDAVGPKATGFLPVAGVAYAAIAANSVGCIQTRGLGQVLVDGSEDPLVASELCVPGGAVAGTVEGFTAGGTTADEVASAIGSAIADVAALDITAPCFISPAGSF